MRNLFSPLLYSLLVGASLTATSCGDKKNDPVVQPPAPATATLSGQVSPAGSITTVTVSNASGPVATATPTSTGAYSFPGLTLGAYTLAYTPAPGYTAPATAAVTLAAGGTAVPTTTVALAPTTATLSGQINPAGAVASVRATNDASGTVYTVTPSSTGAYAFPNLPFGRYTVQLVAASGFNQTISAFSATVVAGGTTVPVFTVSRLPTEALYTLSTGNVVPVYISPQVLGSDRFITFENSTNQRLTLFLQGLTPTVGTVSLTTAANYAQYNGPDFVNYRSNYGSAASGTLTITGVNTISRLYSGNFSFVGGAVNPNVGSPSTRTITNGSFVNISY
ncbi:hypothetical protein ACFST9_09655 [Hymenobacter monticola]|uniref:Carboxypeptidase regulatory-like domain-containing protein n=1 Tax=Hymenobacter monticola TaxID=1705399 RepID=A0ABY4BCU2_9BACT|nr:hypothetical protein [Hymenobacter monticola]UOE35536.1 hypothetical protein MTP16_07750 [Hymenobacter monticola]